MTTLRRHNPQLRAKLLRLAAAGDGAGLLSLLLSLTNSERRTAGYLLAEEVLPAVSPAHYWQLFAAVVPADTKAYLVTFLKAAVTLCGTEGFTVRGEEFAHFASAATPVDRVKVLETLLPALTDADEAAALLALFAADDEELRLGSLLRAGTPLAYYLMFRALRRHESERDLLRHYATLLIRRGDQLSFNMANVIRCYFGVDDIPGTFSMQLPPYMQSRLDAGPELFIKTINNGKI